MFRVEAICGRLGSEPAARRTEPTRAAADGTRHLGPRCGAPPGLNAPEEEQDSAGGWGGAAFFRRDGGNNLTPRKIRISSRGPDFFSERNNRGFHTGRAASDFLTPASKFWSDLTRCSMESVKQQSSSFLASRQNFDTASSV